MIIEDHTPTTRVAIFPVRYPLDAQVCSAFLSDRAWPTSPVRDG